MNTSQNGPRSGPQTGRTEKMPGYQNDQWRDLLRPLVEAMTEYFIVKARGTWVAAQDEYNKPGREGGGR